MELLKRFAVVSLLLLVTGLLAACGGGGAGASAGGGTTSSGSILLTGFTTTGVSGLAYNSGLSGAASGTVVTTNITSYTPQWNDATYQNLAALTYYVDSLTGEEDISFSISPDAGTTIYSAGAAPTTTSTTVYCAVSGTTVSFPLCSSIGITVDRAKGVINLASTPAYNFVTPTATGTMTGSLTFAPF